jgi:hypothetical protein
MFAYTGAPAPSNHTFLDLVSRQVYGIPLPQYPNGSPVSTAQLYSHPSLYGWVELGPDDPKEGALAIWPTMGGLVITGAGGRDYATQQRQRQGQLPDLEGVQVLYPSHQLEGKLTIGSSDYLGDSKPKFIVPRKLIVDDIKVDDAARAVKASAKPPD